MRRFILLLAVLLSASAGAFAQEPAPTPKDKDKPADTKPIHDEIIAMREGLLKAIKEKNVDAALAYLHPDVVVTAQDGDEQKVFRKHEGVKDYFTRHLTGPQAAIKSLQPDVKVDDYTILYGKEPDAGVAFGSSKDHYVLTNGTEFDLPTRWSATMVKHDGKWKVASLQFSSSWFHNPAIDAVSKMMYWVGGIAAVVGLVVGMVLMKVMGGKKAAA